MHQLQVVLSDMGQEMQKLTAFFCGSSEGKAPGASRVISNKRRNSLPDTLRVMQQVRLAGDTGASPQRRTSS